MSGAAELYLLPTTAAVLPPCLVQHHRCSVREIQATIAGPKRNSEDGLRRQRFEQIDWQAARFRTEYEGIPGLEHRCIHGALTLRAQRVDSARTDLVEAGCQISMFLDSCVLRVIESGATQPFIVDTKSERVYEVQLGSDIRAQSDRVAGVRWNFRLIEDQVEHDNAPVQPVDSALAAFAP